MKKVEKKKTADQYLAERAIKEAERARAPQERDQLRVEVANLKAQLGQNNLSLQEKSAIINNLQKNVLVLKDNTINDLTSKLTLDDQVVSSYQDQLMDYLEKSFVLVEDSGLKDDLNNYDLSLVGNVPVNAENYN